MSKVHNKDKNKLKTLSLQQITTRSNKKKMETRTDTAGNKVFIYLFFIPFSIILNYY